MTRWRAFLVLAALTLPGCGANIDLKQSAHLVDVTTGWFDAGVQADGKNKLVPSITFRIKNDGAASIGTTNATLGATIITNSGGTVKSWGTTWSTSAIRFRWAIPLTTAPTMKIRGMMY